MPTSIQISNLKHQVLNNNIIFMLLLKILCLPGFCTAFAGLSCFAIGGALIDLQTLHFLDISLTYDFLNYKGIIEHSLQISILVYSLSFIILCFELYKENLFSKIFYLIYCLFISSYIAGLLLLILIVTCNSYCMLATISILFLITLPWNNTHISKTITKFFNKFNSDILNNPNHRLVSLLIVYILLVIYFLFLNMSNSINPIYNLIFGQNIIIYLLVAAFYAGGFLITMISSVTFYKQLKILFKGNYTQINKCLNHCFKFKYANISKTSQNINTSKTSEICFRLIVAFCSLLACSYTFINVDFLNHTVFFVQDFHKYQINESFSITTQNEHKNKVIQKADYIYILRKIGASVYILLETSNSKERYSRPIAVDSLDIVNVTWIS